MTGTEEGHGPRAESWPISPQATTLEHTTYRLCHTSPGWERLQALSSSERAETPDLPLETLSPRLKVHVASRHAHREREGGRGCIGRAHGHRRTRPRGTPPLCPTARHCRAPSQPPTAPGAGGRKAGALLRQGVAGETSGGWGGRVRPGPLAPLSSRQLSRGGTCVQCVHR